MVSFREAVADSLKSALCAVIALNDDGARLFGRIPGLRSGADYFNFFAPLRADLCNTDPADVPTPDPPFEGGQCSGQFYKAVGRLKWNVFVGSTGTTVPVDEEAVTELIFLGPVSGFSAVYSNPGPNGPRDFEIVFQTAAGPAQGFFRSNAGPTNSVNNARFEGQLLLGDDTTGGCGDPDVIVPPPGPVTQPINVTYNNEDNDIVDIDGIVIFAPVFTTGDLNVKVPFTLDLGGLEWSGNLQITPEFNLEIAPRINFGGPGAVDDPDGLPTADPDDTADPEPGDDESKIIGVIVRSSPIGELRSTAIATSGQPTIYAPRLANCSFAIEAGFTIGWTPDIAVKNRDCYIPCPAPQGAVGVSISAEPGWECTFRAVRGRPLTTTT